MDMAKTVRAAQTATRGLRRNTAAGVLSTVRACASASACRHRLLVAQIATVFLAAFASGAIAAEEPNGPAETLRGADASRQTPTIVAAPAQPSPARTYKPRDPYVGVVTDATVTRIGHDFYNAFSAHWRDQANAEQFSLTVHERPSARWGSLVWVEYANNQLFRAFLSPARRDYVPVAAQEASRIAYQSVVDSEVQRQLFRDPDLAQDEL